MYAHVMRTFHLFEQNFLQFHAFIVAKCIQIVFLRFYN